MSTGRKLICGIWFESKRTRRQRSRWVSECGSVVIVKTRGPEPWVVYIAGSPSKGDRPLGIGGATLADAVHSNEAMIRKALAKK